MGSPGELGIRDTPVTFGCLAAKIAGWGTHDIPERSYSIAAVASLEEAASGKLIKNRGDIETF